MASIKYLVTLNLNTGDEGKPGYIHMYLQNVRNINYSSLDYFYLNFENSVISSTYSIAIIFEEIK